MAQEMAEDRPRGSGRSHERHEGAADSPGSDGPSGPGSAEPAGSTSGAVRPEAEQERRRRLRHRLTQALAIAVIIAVFAFIFPRIASYGAAWRVVSSMTAPWILALAGVTVLNLVVNWWFITACLPGLGLPRAAAMNLSSTAVANTVPGGGAIALGVSWNMASAWGFSGEQFTLYTLVSGLWSQFAKFGTPAVALIALSAVGSANRSLVLATILGTAVFLAALGAVIAALHSDGFMAALGRAAQRFMDWLTGLFHRQGPRHVERGFLDFKHQAAHLLATRGWLISISVLASDLVGWLVQLACLRACGVGAAEVSWEKSFAGYALIRLLTTIPITPGGLGITEVGLTAYLASGLGGAATDRIAAAILLARALTFVVPIPLGAVNFTVWKWLRRRDDPLGPLA
ncbi:lysylphosphatidylglycerol synthase transmembrane domain-containing protein [Actinospica robiniae]|uniref:lysylphosphatidylglycerol synthase transmembrane domain-containing protein n=1 Tax=Actinospica robiniae TaxID=304901 RepID=UPI00040B29D0|nr:lysylphosphatidylglycerol synthase transmembrane domain-containing protein [Actinospica robiniae]